MTSLDTETTGVDFYHGAKPFLVTICHDDGRQQWWEWDVDPLTRMPTIPTIDLAEVQAVIERAGRWGSFDDETAARHRLVLQNAKFDATALSTIIPGLKWPWAQTDDTLIAGHLLASNQPHDLTSMAMQYLGEDIQPCERRLREACLEARRLARRDHPDWRLAKSGEADMPSVKSGAAKKDRGAESESSWKADAWLLRAIAKEHEYAEPAADCQHAWDNDWECAVCGGHRWWTVCADYANTDSAITMALWLAQAATLRDRGLWEIYVESMRLAAVIPVMERRGLTISEVGVQELEKVYSVKLQEATASCMGIAAECNYDLTLPRGGRNKSLDEFVFEVLKLPKVYNPKARSAAPTLDSKNAVPYYLDTLPAGSSEHRFITALAGRRRWATYLTYLAGYKRFWVSGPAPGYRLLHCTLNQTGTNTPRFSSSNPNGQNVGKKELYCQHCGGDGGCDDCGGTGLEAHSLKYCFGPAPGREWYCLDAENLELRIPAYGSGEEGFIDLFERPNDPPYYGSNHLLIAHILHKDKFEACRGRGGEVDGRVFKERYNGGIYRAVKMGNFSMTCGAVEKADGWGTADRAFGVRGAQRLIKERMVKMAELSRLLIRHAEKTGMVETMPDRRVNPTRGYPILCQRTNYGKILATTPFSYHVQGTAMWWMRRCMVECQERLDLWRRRDKFDAFMAMQVHDELVFDMPVRPSGNFSRVADIVDIMEGLGSDLVPTLMASGRPVKITVSVKLHRHNWESGEDVTSRVKSLLRSAPSGLPIVHGGETQTNGNNKTGVLSGQTTAT